MLDTMPEVSVNSSFTILNLKNVIVILRKVRNNYEIQDAADIIPTFQREMVRGITKTFFRNIKKCFYFKF